MLYNNVNTKTRLLHLERKPNLTEDLEYGEKWDKYLHKQLPVHMHIMSSLYHSCEKMPYHILPGQCPACPLLTSHLLPCPQSCCGSENSSIKTMCMLDSYSSPTHADEQHKPAASVKVTFNILSIALLRPNLSFIKYCIVCSASLPRYVKALGGFNSLWGLMK